MSYDLVGYDLVVCYAYFPDYISAVDPETVPLLHWSEVIVHFTHSYFLLNVPGQRPAFFGSTILTGIPSQYSKRAMWTDGIQSKHKAV